ncbi:MAG: rhombosortase [Gammaproteobacteria bacterium]
MSTNTQSAMKSICGHLLIFSLLLIFLQSFQSQLIFHREAIHAGEFWRILTGSFVHTNYFHLFLNLAGIVFIAFLFKDYLSVKTFYVSLFLTSLTVGIGLYCFNKPLQWYAGLSGSLYGLYIVSASFALRSKDYISSLPIIIGIPAKLLFDSIYPNLTEHSAELIGAPIANVAHLYGAIAGLCISIFMAGTGKK